MKEDGFKSPVLKFLGEEKIKELCEIAKAKTGDALFIVSDKAIKTEEILGQVRLHLGRKHDLIKAGEYKFMWVTEFPMFDFDAESVRSLSEQSQTFVDNKVISVEMEDPLVYFNEINMLGDIYKISNGF